MFTELIWTLPLMWKNIKNYHFGDFPYIYVKQFDVKISPIRNEKDYQNPLERLKVIFDAKRGAEEGDETEILIQDC